MWAVSSDQAPACSTLWLAGVRVELQSYQCGRAKEGGGQDGEFAQEALNAAGLSAGLVHADSGRRS